MSYQQQQGGFNRPYNGGNGGGGGYQQRPPQNGFYNNNGGGGGGNSQNSQGQGGQNTPREERPLPEPAFYFPYGVIGSRDTPTPVIERMKSLVAVLSGHDYTMRTGGLDGMEKEAINVCDPTKLELQLPWKAFGGLDSKTSFSSPEVMAIAKHFAGAWDKLPLPVKGFLGKNVRVVLGEKARSLALFIITHSEDGVENAMDVTARTGTAGHAIKVAGFHNIPVFNLQNMDAEERLKRMFHLSQRNTKPMIEDPTDL